MCLHVVSAGMGCILRPPPIVMPFQYPIIKFSLLSQLTDISNFKRPLLHSVAVTQRPNQLTWHEIPFYVSDGM